MLHRFRHIAAAVLLLAGPLLGLAAYRVASDYEEDRAGAKFQEYLSERASSFEREVATVSEALYAIRPLFEVGEHATSQAFKVLTAGILSRHRPIQAMEWIPRVPADARVGHESRVRSAGAVGYEIRQLEPAGDIGPTAWREVYYPVRFVEPIEGNEALLGLDLHSEATASVAIARATDSGELAFSNPVHLPHRPEGAPVWLGFLPVYGQDRSAPPTAGRDLRGFVLLVLRPEILLEHSGFPPDAAFGSRADFLRTDDGVEGRSLVIYPAIDSTEATHLPAGSYQKRIVVGGQEYRLIGRPTPAFLAQHHTRQPLILGLVLFLTWQLLAILILSFAKRSGALALMRQDRLFRTVYHGLTEGVIVADERGKFILFNGAAERILGVGIQDVPPEDWSKIYGCRLPDTGEPYPPDQLPLARAIEGGQVRDSEILIRRPDLPEDRWISVNGGPLTDEDGTAQGGVIVFRDITLRKQREAELGSTLRELRDTRDALDQVAIVSTTDRDGKILSVNDKFCEISGYSRAEILGRDHRLLNSDLHSPDFMRDLWDTIENGRIWKGEIRNRRKDGSFYWIDMTIVPFPDTDGNSIRYMAIQYDLSEHKQADELRQRLFNAIEQTDDTVFITNRDGGIEYVNPAFERTTGYSEAEVLGKTPRILKSGEHDPDHYRTLWATILSGEVYRGTAVNRRKNGETYYAEQTITPMRDSHDQVTHFVSVVKDMTERRKIQAQEIEMTLASRIQRKLYPAEHLALPGLDVAGAAFPAEATCGDYFDYIRTPNGGLAIAIGDVCGHGLGPALIMSAARAHLHSLLQGNGDPGRVLSEVNNRLIPDLEEDHYITLSLTEIDLATRRIVHANAGHPFAYQLDRSGDVKAVLESTGIPLGVLPDWEFPNGPGLALDPGDLLLFLTDGFIESDAADGSEFGTEGVLDVVRSHRHLPAKEIVEQVRIAVRDHSRDLPQRDDMTIIICKFDPQI